MGLVVRLLNPAQVAAVRKQQGNRRRKTDWLDAAAIGELLARGEGSPVHLDASPAATLRPLWSGRKDLVDARGRLRQQAGALVDCLWPGFSAADQQAGVTPVVSDSFDTKAGRVVVGLLAEGWTPASVAATSVAELRALFAARGCRLSGPLAGRLIGRAASALPAHPAASAGKAAALAALDGQIGGLEAERPRCWPPPRAPSSPRSAGWPRSRPPGSLPSWATPAAGASGPRCGGRPGWTRPAANPAPLTKATASAGKARPGAGERSWTWPPASAASQDASTPATRPGSMPASTPGGAGRGRQPGRADLLCSDGQRRRLRP